MRCPEQQRRHYSRAFACQQTSFLQQQAICSWGYASRRPHLCLRSAWLQKMIMRSTCSCPEQQTRSKQLRNKRDNNAFFEGMPDNTCLSEDRKTFWAQNTRLHILVRIDFPKMLKNQSAAENVKQSSLLYEARAGYTTARRETPKIKMRDTRTA